VQAGTLISAALPCCGDAPVLRGRDLDVISLALSDGLAARKASQARVRQQHAVLGASAPQIPQHPEAGDPVEAAEAVAAMAARREKGDPAPAMLSRFELCDA
jgi:hypothetical protein